MLGLLVLLDALKLPFLVSVVKPLFAEGGESVGMLTERRCWHCE